MEKLKRDIYNYFLPMASDPQTALIVTYAILEIVQHHMSEYVYRVEQLLATVAELCDANVKLQNRVQESEESFINGMRLAYDTISAISEQQRGEERLDTLEEFQKEL